MHAATTHHQPNYSTKCPNCGDERGVVRSAATVAGRPNDIIVTLECRSCTHEWQQSFEQLERSGRPRPMTSNHRRGPAARS